MGFWRHFFLVCVERRDAGTLIPIIEKHIEKGTKIMSDCWAAYSKLSEIGYEHETVNHSTNFVGN